MLLHRAQKGDEKFARVIAAFGPSIALAWADYGFPVLEPSHTLAASLMATSVSESVADTLELPWRCFAIHVPAGLLGEERLAFILKSRDTGAIRMWRR